MVKYDYFGSFLWLVECKDKIELEILDKKCFRFFQFLSRPFNIRWIKTGIIPLNSNAQMCRNAAINCWVLEHGFYVIMRTERHTFASDLWNRSLGLVSFWV